jgi:Conjugative transposon protein TcpC
VANTPRTIAKTSLLRVRFAPGRTLSDAALARAGAVLLWALVVLAAAGGIYAFVRSPSGSASETSSSGTDTMSESVWAASGFAERYVSTYLLAGADGRHLTPFLGYTPELPPTQQPVEPAAPARVVDVQAAGDEYWSITVAVGPPGQERYWRAAVDTRGGQPVAVGLPTAVAGPAEEVERVDLDLNLAQPPTDDPVAETMTGFLGAYLCGQGDLSRYLRPGLTLTAADPAVCSQVELVRWGTSDTEADTRTVVAEVRLISGSGDAATTLGSTYTAEMARRDGRWEVAELLPAPPRQDEAG